MTTVAPLPVLIAPANWRTVDFISDLHLSAEQPATLAAWEHYFANTPADAVFLLGDLFEVWVGDDVLADSMPDSAEDFSPSFEAHCAEVLRNAAERRALFFMHGNRDFLVGQQLMARCRMQLLNDPTVLESGSRRWLLSHGDALCLADTDYLTFRAQVRSPAWQNDFLAKPLPERQAIARALRSQSEARKAGGAVYADVDNAAAKALLDAGKADTLIHGHTHKPGQHPLGEAKQRVVLSDWDMDAQPARAEALRLDLGSGELLRCALVS